MSKRTESNYYYLLAMVKLIFYGWERGMHKIPFTKLLNEKTNLGLKKSKDIMDRVMSGETCELIIDDDKVADEIYEKSREYKVLVRKEVM